MIKKHWAFLLLAAFLCQALAWGAPLRVFIRAGEKSHGPGAHDFPAFLQDWTKLLNERGMQAEGALSFPTREQLAKTDVLILHSQEGGNIEGQDRANLEAFLQRGGGLVVVHAAAVSNDAEWYQSVIGGSWKWGQTKWLEGPMSLYFTELENPITKDCSNFDIDDEIYYDMVMNPKAKILAATFTPNPKNPQAGEQPGKVPNIYDIEPQMWTYETDHHRAFVCIPGHWHKNFSHNTLRTILLRGIAWAGKRPNVDEFCKPDELGETLRYPVGGPTAPSEAAKKIELHPEFDLSLVASEPLIQKVIDLDWDEKGRLWVVETPEYPNGRKELKTTPWEDSGSLNYGVTLRDPQDRISILADTDGDGVMDKKHVFADKLELATGFVFYKNGVIVSAAPDIWYLEDTNGDMVADKRTKLYTGLGTMDAHAVINNLRWGLDGWVYATHGYSGGDVTALGRREARPVPIGSGVVRFLPDGSQIEMWSSRGGNTWGLDMTSDGECFWTQPTSGTLFFHTVLPETVLAQGRIPGTESWKGMISNQKVFPAIHWEQQAYRQIDQVGSYTAAAGCAIYEGGAWPEKWNYSFFTCEPTVNILSQYFVAPAGPSYQVAKEQGRENTEFVRSTDLWFRPVGDRVGPDGALYVVDFYNQAVIHNDTRGPRHGPTNAAVRPDRDHYFGRIWRIQHKQAKQLEPVVMSKSDPVSLQAGLRSPNGHTRIQAMRLLRESGHPVAVETGSKVYREYEKLKTAKTPAERLAVLKLFAEAGDDWTRSAAVAIGNQDPVAYLQLAMQSEEAAKLDQFFGLLAGTVLNRGGAAEVEGLVHAVATAPEKAASLKVALLDRLAGQKNLVVAMSPGLERDLGVLLQDPATADHVLPLISRWDTGGRMKNAVETLLTRLVETLGNHKEAPAERIRAGRLLAQLSGDKALQPLGAVILNAQENENLQRAIIQELGNAGHADRLARAFPKLPDTLREAAFDEIVKRPEAVMALLADVEAGRVSGAEIGPGNVSRLRNHPDSRVAARANELVDKLVPGGKERSETIAKLLPEVSKPGNAEHGKQMFEAACMICHRYGDLGDKEAGPPLTGMGSHGVAELLTHIIDPNREVDPSFWQWNITLKDGETLAGIIVNENPATLVLRNQGGDTEVRKDNIATRVNTHRSLMPEGLEGLGAETLRDILTFLTQSDGRFRVIDLREAYTADSRRGLFNSAEATGDSVFPSKFGDIQARGIPFYLMDPATSPNGKNLVVLKGGAPNTEAFRFPQKVEVMVNQPATRFYLMSGIAGWGYPAIRDKRPALKVTVNFADGTREVTELFNGVEFADYIGEFQVPGSLPLPGVVTRGQARLITLPLTKEGMVKSLSLESHNNHVTPVVMAVTADLSHEPAVVETAAKAANDPQPLDQQPADSTAATGQKFGSEPGALKVLVAGAGSSHNFPRDFIATDVAMLRKLPQVDAVGTMNAAEALMLLPQADVLVFSGNDDEWGTPEFQKALHAFADAGKGMIFLHPGTWQHPWEGYNQRFVGGETSSHGYGQVTTRTMKHGHPVVEGVPDTFQILDESYHTKLFPQAKTEVLIANEPDGQSPALHPALWLVQDPKARIVCYTHGHAVEAHAHPAYQRILTNAVLWVGKRK